MQKKIIIKEILKGVKGEEIHAQINKYMDLCTYEGIIIPQAQQFCSIFYILYYTVLYTNTEGIYSMLYNSNIGIIFVNMCMLQNSAT